jgi:hypothetical protein
LITSVKNTFMNLQEFGLIEITFFSIKLGSITSVKNMPKNMKELCFIQLSNIIKGKIQHDKTFAAAAAIAIN